MWSSTWETSSHLFSPKWRALYPCQGSYQVSLENSCFTTYRRKSARHVYKLVSGCMRGKHLSHRDKVSEVSYSCYRCSSITGGPAGVRPEPVSVIVAFWEGQEEKWFIEECKVQGSLLPDPRPERSKHFWFRSHLSPFQLPQCLPGKARCRRYLKKMSYFVPPLRTH